MCRFFLASQSLKLPEGDSDYFSFLVPMERVFEEFIAGFIRSHFSGLQPEVQSVYELARAEGKRVFGIKNDIWLPGSSVILDTKYKCIDSRPQDIFSQINQGDIYQMIAYAIRRNSTEVHLLYPQTMAEATDFTFEVTDALAAETIHIHIHLIPVMVPDESLLAGKSVDEVLTPLLKKKFAAILKSEPD
jgi:5-methylcytosine-specific restriction enzyme subunit McrC